MTAEEIARLQALCAAATPGPWDHAPPGGCVVASAQYQHEQVALACGAAAMRDERMDTYEVQRANAEFIAAARDALPILLAEVVRLRAEVAERNAILRDLATYRRIHVCGICDAVYPSPHRDGCPWLRARRLLGIETEGVQ
jgi:hypothetical protein